MSNPVLPKAAVFSLYRSYLRQIRQLPTEYLRQFFRIKAHDDVRTVFKRASRPALQKIRVRGIKHELKKLKTANLNPGAFEHLLSTAYGRIGKLKHELLEPILTDPGPKPPPIIPGVEKSRPPVYSPEMRALSQVAHARSVNKPLLPEKMDRPGTLPPRADPDSEEARFMGPFSKRREKNMRWRYFVSETRKTYPPLEVVFVDKTESGVVEKSDEESIKAAGLRPMGLQGLGVLDDLLQTAQPPPRIPTRRQRRAAQNDQSAVATEPQLAASAERPVHSRYVRRRVQVLLHNIPILSASPRASGGFNFKVSMPRLHLSTGSRYSSTRMPEAAPTHLAWLDHAEAQKRPPKRERKESRMTQ